VTTAVIDQWPKDSWGISGTIVGNLHDIGREIRARVEKLNQLGGKTVDMVDSINHLLDDARKLCDEAGFEAFKKSCCPELGQSRVYELLAIKEGRKTLEEIREAGRLRVAKHRAEKKRASQDVTEKDSVTSSPPALPNKVTVNGQTMDIGRLGAIAQAKIAEALGPPFELIVEPEPTVAPPPSGPKVSYLEQPWKALEAEVDEAIVAAAEGPARSPDAPLVDRADVSD
jgi:hypothetical protein